MSKVEKLIFDPRLGHPDLPEASLGATCSRLNVNALNPALLLNLLSSCETLLHAVQTIDTLSNQAYHNSIWNRAAVRVVRERFSTPHIGFANVGLWGMCNSFAVDASIHIIIFNNFFFYIAP